MYSIPTRKIPVIQRSMAVLFLGLSIWLIAASLGVIDSSTLTYSRCRACPRVVSPSIWTVGLVGAMFLAFSASMLVESFARKGSLASFFGSLGWLLLCAALMRHTLYSDDPVSLRVWTGAFALIFSISFVAVYWSIHRSRGQKRSNGRSSSRASRAAELRR